MIKLNLTEIHVHIEYIIVINRLLMGYNFLLEKDHFPVNRILSDSLALINNVNTL